MLLAQQLVQQLVQHNGASVCTSVDQMCSQAAQAATAAGAPELLWLPLGAQSGAREVMPAAQTDAACSARTCRRAQCVFSCSTAPERKVSHAAIMTLTPFCSSQ